MNRKLLFVVLLLVALFVVPTVAAQDATPTPEAPEEVVEPVDVESVDESLENGELSEADAVLDNESGAVIDEEPIEEPPEGGTIGEDAAIAIFVLSLIAGLKLAERNLPTVDLPEGSWSIVQVGLTSIFTFTGAALKLLNVDVDLGPLFVEAAGIVDGLVAFVTILIGSGVLYFIARNANVPLLGYSKTIDAPRSSTQSVA
jgi:hypothetical protein